VCDIATSAVKLDEARLQLAKDKAERDLKEAEAAKGDERKRAFNSMTAVDVTAEDMEVYRQKRTKGEDPMADLLDSDTVLEYDEAKNKAKR
jgi:hypothetical protein